MYPERVKYQLEEYERIIGSVKESCRRKGAGCSAIGKSVRTEVGRIKQTFINEIFGFSDERHLERYIQYHQMALIRLMDESVTRSHAVDRIVRQGYQHCYHGLEDLLAFIEKHFAKYFDQHAKAPEAYIVIVKNDIRSNVDVLHKGLLSRIACPILTDAVLHVLHGILEEDPANEVTYRNVLYAKELQRELSRLISNPDRGVDVNDALRSLMYYLNYNSVKAFTCQTQYINTLISEAETRSEKIEKLSYLLKRVNQAQVKPGVSYNFYVLDLRTQVNSYIVEELEHLQRMHSLVSGLYTSGGIFSTVKIQLGMSVAQVAYLIKLFIDAKIIVNKNLTELLRFISTFLVSKKNENISYDSLRAKYYNVEQGTKEAVKANLLRMLSLIERE